jgi:tRNA pseudouridine38-40 synthase
LRNLKLLITYDGTDFHGWQKQQGLRTVQGELDRVIEIVTGVVPTTLASGRTDAGVHALGQVVSFLTESRLSPEILARAFNAMLPFEVRVLSACDVPEAFHATLDAVSKHYRYQVDNRTVADPFLRRTAWHQPRPLDAGAMHAAAQVLLGRHDFRSFETEWPNRVSSVRTVFDIAVRRTVDLVRIEVEADGFLYNMVRSIAGSLVLIGKGNREPCWLETVLAAQDRRAAGPNAPPQGLFLVSVRYADTGSHASRPSETPRLRQESD